MIAARASAPVITLKETSKNDGKTGVGTPAGISPTSLTVCTLPGCKSATSTEGTIMANSRP
jgi:hypothetical protein